MEFYLTSFLNMKGWRVKCRNFLDDFPVHYTALFKIRNINNKYMTLLMALHHTHDKLWYFFRCFKINTHSWYNFNFETANKKPSSVRLAAFFLSNYHSYKEKTIKLPPCHSFYGGHIPLRKIMPPFLTVRLKKNSKPPGCPFSSILLKKFKFHLSWSLQHSTLNMCGYYFFLAEYKLVKWKSVSYPYKGKKIILSRSIYLPHTVFFFTFWKDKCMWVKVG